MKNQKPLQSLNKIFTFILVLVVITSSTIISTQREPETGSPCDTLDSSTYYKAPSHSETDTIDVTKFIDMETFYTSTANASYRKIETPAIGAIAPHHDIAAPLIADIFNTLSKSTAPDTIILLGPNHYGEEKAFLLADFDYATYNGTLHTDKNIANNLLQTPYLFPCSKDLIQGEHSLNILLNYVDYYFDDVTVVPILTGNIGDETDIVHITEALINATKDKNCLFIGSIDFSHYLPLEEANKKDAITAPLLETMSSSELMKLNNDYLDSPATHAVLVSVLSQTTSNLNSQIIDHSNMAILLDRSDLESTTSYFTVLYTD